MTYLWHWGILLQWPHPRKFRNKFNVSRHCLWISLCETNVKLSIFMQQMNRFTTGSDRDWVFRVRCLKSLYWHLWGFGWWNSEYRPLLDRYKLSEVLVMISLFWLFDLWRQQCRKIWPTSLTRSQALMVGRHLSYSFSLFSSCAMGVYGTS